ncbi:hypothetical protein D3C86_1921880 [compost metagenome]
MRMQGEHLNLEKLRISRMINEIRCVQQAYLQLRFRPFQTPNNFMVKRRNNDVLIAISLS